METWREFPSEVMLETIEVPKDQVYLLVARKPHESLADWAKRCGVLYNVKEPE